MNLRGRIAWSMLSVVAIGGGVCALVGGYLLHRSLGEEAENRVRQDLNAAREFYEQRLEAMRSSLLYTAIGERLAQAVAERDLPYLTRRLEAVRRGARLDTLCATDAAGRVILRAHRPEAAGDSRSDDRLVARVLGGDEGASGTLLVPMAALEREGRLLAERARMRILPTARAKPSEATELDAGMMLGAAVPVHGPDGRLVGTLCAGILLNRHYDLVDQVQNTVFRGEQYHGKLVGTATIFQDDVRISTNVLQEDGSRAIGSRVSEEVHDRVLHRGETWLGRAWVVNGWYIAAYAPIADVEGQAVGMLYVGALDRKFSAVIWRTITTFVLVTLVGLLAAAAVAWHLAHSISRPVSQLARAAAAIAEGDFSQALPVESADEIGSLTHTFNTMTQSLKERDELLRERTRQQLTRSERLASVGRLAAGVAHEINNPLTGVLTFAHLLHRDALPDSQNQQDLQTIIDATTRCRDIVRGLLNFARQSEPHKRLCDLNDVLRQALNLTRNQAHIHGIQVAEELSPTLPPLIIDPNQIQEVAVNIIFNAIDAMPGGGTLTARTRASRADGSEWAEFEIVDTGCGIAPEILDRIFDPFFTTKPAGKGTGLGLAVSYGIVTEHGGQIAVASEVNHGTSVTVRLPLGSRESRPSDPPPPGTTA